MTTAALDLVQQSVDYMLACACRCVTALARQFRWRAPGN